MSIDDGVGERKVGAWRHEGVGFRCTSRPAQLNISRHQMMILVHDATRAPCILPPAM